jgi:hypothetical protein
VHFECTMTGLGVGFFDLLARRLTLALLTAGCLSCHVLFFFTCFFHSVGAKSSFLRAFLGRGDGKNEKYQVCCDLNYFVPAGKDFRNFKQAVTVSKHQHMRVDQAARSSLPTSRARTLGLVHCSDNLQGIDWERVVISNRSTMHVLRGSDGRTVASHNPSARAPSKMVIKPTTLICFALFFLHREIYPLLSL